MMLGYLWILLFVMMGSFSLAIFSHQRMGMAIPSFLFFVMVYLYIFGIFFPLDIVAYIGLGITVISFLIALYRSKQKGLLAPIQKDAILWLFVALFFCICFINSGKHISYIDEYTHWGDVVKAMYQNHTLAIYQDNSWYASYPPAMSLLQYFFMLVNGSFQEDILYIVSQMFIVSLYLPFIKNLKQWKSYFVMGALLLIAPMIFTVNFYDNIYVDTCLGVLFAHNIAYLFQQYDLKKYDVFYLSLSLVTLVLLKDIGFFLALMNGIILLYTCHRRFPQQLSTVWLMIALIFISRFSFSTLLAIQHVTLQHQRTVSLSQIISLLTGHATAFQIKVLQNFISRVCNSNLITNPISLNYIGILCLFYGLSYGFQRRYLKKKEQQWWGKVTVWLIVGSIIYLVGLLATYLFQMQTDYAIGLSSFSRYITIFISGAFYTLMFCFFQKEPKDHHFLFLLLILICFMPMYQVPSMFQKRNRVVEEDIIALGQTLQKTDRILIYDSHGELYDHARVHYYIRPYELEDQAYITEVYQLSRFNQYDYFYIYHIDQELLEYLKTEYQMMVKEKTLYRIQEGTLILAT